MTGAGDPAPRPRPWRVRLRPIWLRAHLYLGLTLGLLLALLGLTGSFLVFNHAIDEWLNPALLRATRPDAPRAPVAAIVQAADAAARDLTPTSRLLMPPRHPGGVFVVYQTEPGEGHGRLTEIHVDPTTALVLGRRVWGEYFVSWVYMLHSHLHAGEAGETAVGLSGVALLASVATGLLLWWPILRRGGLRAAARVKRSHLNFDLHKVAGVGSSLALAVVAFSGVYMVFPHWFAAPLAAVAPLTPFVPVTNPPAPAGTAAEITADAALDAARPHFPGARWVATSLPVKPTDPYVVTFRRPGEVRRTWGRCVAWVDRHTGATLKVQDGNVQTAGDVFADWQFPLHNGEAFDLPGRWLVFATGLSPTLLGVTGALLWWRKRRGRARQRARGVGHPRVARMAKSA